MLRTLLRTKLYKPRSHHVLVDRIMLMQRIEDGSQGDLTVIAAPAGYGKTTIVAEWAKRTSIPVAWLTLVEYDNDLTAFLTYTITAIRTLHPAACSDLEGLLSASLPPRPEWLATIFCKEVNELPERFVLVLDDFQVMTDPQVHQFIDTLLRRPPSQMHLLITSRAEPPLALGRLRANRRLNELRMDDLRFSPQETATLLGQMEIGQPVNVAAASLLARTGGWVAGLHLAALTIAGASNRRPAVADKNGGANRLITDYLVEQVFEQQTEAVQMFLLKTSILERISSPLAAAVLNGDQAPAVVSVEALAQAGIFLDVLDDRSEWYTYHTLFGDVLRQRLHATFSAGEIAELHRRAGRWYIENGVFDDALHHAFAAGDEQMALQIVVDFLPVWLETDNWRTIKRRLDLFRTASIEQHPWLLMAKGHVLHLQHRFGALAPILHRIEALVAEGEYGLTPAQNQLLRGYLHALWAVHWSWHADVQRAMDAAQQALQKLPEEQFYMRGVLLFILTIAQQSSGQADAAEQLLNATLARAAQVDEGAMLRPLMCLLILYFAEGHVAQASSIGQTLLQKAMDLESRQNQVWAHLALGVAAYEINDLESAARHFEWTLGLRYATNARGAHECLVGLALTYQAMGRREEAEGVLAMMEEFHQELASPALTAEAVSLRRRLALLNGEPDPGAIRESGFSARTSIWYGWLEIPALTNLRAALAGPEPASWKPIEAALEQMLLTAAQLHKVTYVAGLLALKAVLHVRQHDESLGRHVLRQALAIGEPRGLVRSIIDAGLQLEPLLAAIAVETPSAYVQRLHSLLAGSGLASAGLAHRGAARTSARQVAVDNVNLTRREREVLALLGQQQTDREIAAALVISPLTVRTHIENLSSKLSVQGRRSIVMRAREQGLLS